MLTSCDQETNVLGSSNDEESPDKVSSQNQDVNASGDPKVSERSEENEIDEEAARAEAIANKIIDDPEAPVIEKAPLPPIPAQPIGMDELNLTADQQENIQAWVAENTNGGMIDPADLAKHIESLLEDDQKEAFKKMLNASGRSFENRPPEEP